MLTRMLGLANNAVCRAFLNNFDIQTVRNESKHVHFGVVRASFIDFYLATHYACVQVQ